MSEYIDEKKICLVPVYFKSVYSILRQEQRGQQPHKAQNMDRKKRPTAAMYLLPWGIDYLTNLER